MIPRPNGKRTAPKPKPPLSKLLHTGIGKERPPSPKGTPGLHPKPTNGTNPDSLVPAYIDKVNAENKKARAARRARENSKAQASVGDNRPAAPVKAVVAPNVTGKQIVKNLHTKATKAKNKPNNKAAAARAATAPKAPGRVQSQPSGHSAGKGAGRSQAPKNRSGKGSKAAAARAAGSKGSTATGSTTSGSDYNKKAKSAVDLMLNPKIDALNSQDNAIASEYTKQRNDLDTATGRQLSDLSTTYKQLDNFLSSLNNNTQQAYGNAVQQSGNVYDALNQGLQGINTGQQANVSGELARLGLDTGIGAPDQSGLQNDAAFNQGLAQSQKAQAAQLLLGLGANAAGTGNAQRGNYAAMGVDSQTQAKQAAAQMLQDLIYQRTAKHNDIQSQLADVQGQRGDLTQQMLTQFEQQAYDRMMEQQQQDFMNQMNVNGFNLKQDQYAADQNYRNAQLALEGQKLVQQQKLAQQRASQPGAQKNGGMPTGYSGAMSYLNNSMTDPAHKAILASLLQKMDTHRQNTTSISGVPNPDNWSQSSYSDKGKIMNWLVKQLRQPGNRSFSGPRAQSLLSNALNVYFGKFGG